jgi:hypothetical protein
VEVNGVAREIALRPAPVAVLEDEAGEGGQQEIVTALLEELEAASWSSRKRGAGRAARICWRLQRVWRDGLSELIRVDHSLFSNGVE